MEWLESNGLDTLRGFLMQQLAVEPTNSKKKRVTQLKQNKWEIAYRTWRVQFEIIENQTVLKIVRIYSGYTKSELEDGEDPYEDKDLHRKHADFYQT